MCLHSVAELPRIASENLAALCDLVKGTDTMLVVLGGQQQQHLQQGGSL